jgi:hypothetical protein
MGTRCDFLTRGFLNGVLSRYEIFSPLALAGAASFGCELVAWGEISGTYGDLDFGIL